MIPSDIAGLMTWLKADALSLSDTDPVGTWTDSSGNGNSPTEATTSLKPLFRTNRTPTGLPAVVFDGNDDRLTWGNFMSGKTAGEIFCVLKAVSGGEASLWKIGTDPDGLGTYYKYSGDGNIYDGFGSTVRQNFAPGVNLETTFRVFNVASKAGEYTARLDGVQKFTTASNTVAWRSAPVLGFFGAGWQGEIAELIIYDSVLSSSDRTAIYDYLVARNITIPVAGSSTGLATSAASLSGGSASVVLAASAAGVAAASGALADNAVAGSAIGAATVAAPVLRSLQVGSASGAATVSVTMKAARALSVTSAGVAAVTDALVILPVTGNYRDLVLSDSPIAYWPCSEVSGATAVDASGHGRDASITGSVVQGEPGLRAAGKSFRFPGTSGSYVRWTTGGAGIPNVNKLSVEMLLRANTLRTGTPSAMWQIGASSDGHAFLRASDPGLRQGELQAALPGGSTTVTDSQYDLVPGRTYHLVVTWDGATGRIYVNGLQAISWAAAGGAFADTWFTFPWNNTDGRQVDGWISDVAIYDYALPAARVAVHYDASASNHSDGVATASVIPSLIGLTASSAGQAAVTDSLMVYATATFAGTGASSGTANATRRVQGIPTRVKRERELARQAVAQGSDLP